MFCAANVVRLEAAADDRDRLRGVGLDHSPGDSQAQVAAGPVVETEAARVRLS